MKEKYEIYVNMGFAVTFLPLFIVFVCAALGLNVSLIQISIIVILGFIIIMCGVHEMRIALQKSNKEIEDSL
jgi:uncharacterized membrane protein